jgi:hypothetical protein
MVGTSLLVKPVVVYLAGLITGPLLIPVVKGSVKGTVKAGLHVKKLVDDAAAEVTTEKAVKEPRVAVRT